MEKIDFLRAYRHAVARERRITEKILTLREREASASAIRYTDMPKSRAIRDLSDYMADLEEKIAELVAQKRRTDAVMDLWTRVVNRLGDREQYEILYYRYVKGWSVTKITAMLGSSSRSRVYRMQDAALARLEITPEEYDQMAELLYFS